VLTVIVEIIVEIVVEVIIGVLVCPVGFVRVGGQCEATAAGEAA